MAERVKFAGRLLDATTPFTIAPEFRFNLPYFIIFGDTYVAIEQTISIIKPDAVAKNVIGKIYSRFEDAGLKIVAAKMVHLSQLPTNYQSRMSNNLRLLKMLLERNYLLATRLQ